MIIERYSIHKFTPQYQNHHLQGVNYHLNNFDINTFPEHLQNDIMKQHEEKTKFYKEHYNDLQYGIWAFIEGYKNNQALNHLKRKVPHWRAEISNNTIVIDSNWSKYMKITDNECKLFGFFIPRSQLSTLKIL